ncbi:hypothetical protein [Azospirillum thermophilum]|uniref:Uncharacterized protein n=1 Tax=Azospirillum thermophilum TaxID=2202148 RepID=A0A2S2CT40_9PROT|nr:hypothetical protein [Azospirillum thermophilum]AWK87646.1 hypothetical protein DEW08_16780 [Azospirillum thermophilum]
MPKSEAQFGVRYVTGGSVRLSDGDYSFRVFGGIEVAFGATGNDNERRTSALAAIMPPLIKLLTRLAA